MFVWKKLGIVYRPDGAKFWNKTHAMAPTPILLNENVIRVFYTTLDDKGIGRPTFVDLDARRPQQILYSHPEPLLDVGVPGSFDDNGVMVTSIIRLSDEKFFMYYVGFEKTMKIRYRLFTGLAISEDGGCTFSRYSQVPILDRSDAELYFRGGPFVLFDDGIFKMWYVAGSKWLELSGKALPVYEIRYLESGNGIIWGNKGQVVLPITKSDEHGFGRPWIVNMDIENYHMFYSVRRKSLMAYRLGYARSSDGLTWHRFDENLGLDTSPLGFDSEAIMYSAVVHVHGKWYCFYNGNNFGKDGFALAELDGSI